MSENKAPQTFSFEKHMGSDTLRFEVTVQLLGIDPPKPAITCSLGSMPATSGESLWFVTVKGPANTSTANYVTYAANVEPQQVAHWSLAFRCTPC